MITMIRADDRLVHGLVAVSWTAALHPETILVADDVTANDDFKKMTMKMAQPAGVKMVIKTKDKAIAALNNPINDKKNIFVIVASAEDAYYIYQNVKGIKRLNIGSAGINKKPGETYVATLPQVYMTQKDFECAKKMNDEGVEVFAQVSPSLDRMNFPEIAKCFEK